MISRYPGMYVGIIVLTALFALLGLWLPVFWADNAWVLAVALILLIGIPHGATDHLIFSRLGVERFGRNKWILFFSGYLGLMLLYGILWWLAPVLSLGLFLVMSAYHFGQSNWSFLWEKSALGGVVVSMIWGSWVIFTPLLLQAETSLVIVAQIIGKPLQVPTNLWMGAIALLVFNLLAMGYIFSRGWIGIKEFSREIFHVILLELLFFTCPLVLSFAVYFTLWHALGSMQDQVDFFSRYEPRYRWLEYFRQVIPMTVLALLGLAGFVAWQYTRLLEGNIAAMFVFIAILTLPHMILMEKLYKILNNAK